jgi:hypothetical protein
MRGAFSGIISPPAKLTLCMFKHGSNVNLQSHHISTGRLRTKMKLIKRDMIGFQWDIEYDRFIILMLMTGGGDRTDLFHI